MHHARHRGRVFLGILFLLAGMGIGLCGCTMTEDRVTGVTLDHNRPNHCLKDCVDGSQDLVRAEAKYHQEQIRACDELRGDARRACHEAETARHKAAMAQIADGRRECMNGCHRQGGGQAS